MNPDDVKDILAGAVKAVADAKVPAELKSLAFEKAIGLLAGSAAATTPGTALAGAAAAPAAPASVAAGSAIERLATRLRLPQEVVEAV